VRRGGGGGRHHASRLRHGIDGSGRRGGILVAEAEAEGAPPLPEMPSRTVRSYLVEGIGLVRRETLQAGTRVHWKLEQFSAGGGGL